MEAYGGVKTAWSRGASMLMWRPWANRYVRPGGGQIREADVEGRENLTGIDNMEHKASFPDLVTEDQNLVAPSSSPQGFGRHGHSRGGGRDTFDLRPTPDFQRLAFNQRTGKSPIT